MSNRIKQEHALDYMLAGNATVVLLSTKTGTSFRIRVAKSKKAEDLWYVTDILTRIAGEPAYLGAIKKDTGKVEFYTRPGLPTQAARTAQAVAYTIKHLRIQQVPDELHILHMGYCSYCSRPLKDAISLERGIGPICRGKLGIP